MKKIIENTETRIGDVEKFMISKKISELKLIDPSSLTSDSKRTILGVIEELEQALKRGTIYLPTEHTVH